MPVLVRIDAYDPVAAAPVTLRAASEDDDRICHLDGTAWWPAIAELPKLRYDLFDGDFSGRIQTPASSMRLSIEPWPLFGRYALADARIRIWTGDAGASFASWTLRFDGRVTAQPRIAAGVAELPFAVDDSWLDAPLLSTYAGTGGAEGPEALKGSPKPLAIGAPRYVAGVLVDPVKLIWQVSAYGPVQGFEDALDGLARFGTPAADHAGFAALEAATIAPGDWATCKYAGLARFGAPPNGQISFMLSGDAAGGWSRKPGQIIRRIAQIAGGTGKIEDASLDALDLARPWDLSVAIGSQITARELIQRIAASVNAVAGMSWTGRLFAVPIGINASQMTLAADGSMMPQVREVEQIAVGAPWWRLTTQADRTWEVHAPAAVQYSEPAEPGATRGAPTGTSVAGRSASQVVADLDQNALNMLAEQTLASTWRVERDQLIFMADGTPVRTVTEQLGIETDDIQLFVTEVKEVNPVSGESKFLLAANADGVITGIYGLSGSSGLSELGFMASRFLFVDDSGLNPVTAMVYEGGVWKMKAIEVDTLKVGAMDYEFVLNQTITSTQGSQKLPGGVVMKWGRYRAAINDEVQLSIVFDDPFPTECQSFVPVPYLSTFSNYRDLWLQNVGALTRFGATVATQAATSNAQAIDGFDWLAFGI